MSDIDDATLERLLSTERERTVFSEEARAQMWAGVELSLTPQPTGPGARPARVNDNSEPATPNRLADPSPAPSLVGSTDVARGSLHSTARLFGTAVVAALAGAGAGAGAHAHFTTPSVVLVDSPALAPPTIAPQPVPPLSLSVAPPQGSARPDGTVGSEPALGPKPSGSLPPRPTPSTPPRGEAETRGSASVPVRSDPHLARERTLLDMARTALTRGDTSAALAATETHAREFPVSQLGEEREVLAVQALVAAGRLSDARRRAASFHQTYPHSALTGIVDEVAR